MLWVSFALPLLVGLGWSATPTIPSAVLVDSAAKFSFAPGSWKRPFYELTRDEYSQLKTQLGNICNRLSAQWMIQDSLQRSEEALHVQSTQHDLHLDLDPGQWEIIRNITPLVDFVFSKLVMMDKRMIEDLRALIEIAYRGQYEIRFSKEKTMNMHRLLTIIMDNMIGVSYDNFLYYMGKIDMPERLLHTFEGFTRLFDLLQRQSY